MILSCNSNGVTLGRHGTAHRPAHHSRRPAQEGAVRGSVRNRGPDAVAGGTAPDPRVHRATHRPAMAAGGDQEAALAAWALAWARRMAVAMATPSSSAPPTSNQSR